MSTKPLDGIAGRLEQHNLAAAIELARAAADIAGYGPVKDASVVRYESRLKVLLEDFGNQGDDRILAVG